VPFASRCVVPLDVMMVADNRMVGWTGAEKGHAAMSILAWILVGLIGGAVAQLLVKDDPVGGGIAGLVVTVLLGIAGALLGGFIAVALGISDGVDDFDIGTIFLSIVGAVLILLAWKALAGRRALT
jgi:uncharacterized membrane protein YeaQ/YmgE (transglycosylase-associated protein family)